jgi:Lrp/AsnC family transcriptional regulator for asnA, asnC and gidA
MDGIDRSIIEALQQDGREPFRRIAVRLGVSEATVRSRYARLRDASCVNDPHTSPSGE